MRWPLLFVGLAILGCDDDVVKLPQADVGELPLDKDAGGEEVGLVAVVVPRESTDVGSNIAGLVASVDVRIGDEVKEGQPLAAIDDRPLYEELALARATQRTSSATLHEFEVEVKAAEETLRLEKKNVELNVGAKRKQVEAEFALERAVAQRDQAKARVSEQSARIKSLRRQISDAVVRAPFAGTIAVRYLDPGVVVGIGTPVVRLIGSGALRVRFAVDVEHANALKVGDEYNFEATEPKVRLPVVVTQVAPEIDPITQLLVVEADFKETAEAQAALQSGVTGRVLRR